MSGDHLGELIRAEGALRHTDLSGLDGGGLRRFISLLSEVIDGLSATRARLAHHAANSAVWAESGASSPEAFVAGQASISRGRARGELELGRALQLAPDLADVPHANASQVARVTGHPAFADHGASLVAAAATADPRTMRFEIERWKALHDPVADAADAEVQRSRRFLRFLDRGDGMVGVEGAFDPECGAQVRLTLEHLARQHRLDDSGRLREQRLADALTDLCAAHSAGAVTGGRERPTLVVEISEASLSGRANERARIHNGSTLTAEAARRLACDCGIHRLLTAADSVPLDMGRRTRVVGSHVFLALAARDLGCVFPGCDRPPGWCQAHHIVAWESGGATDVANLVLLCHHHHHLVHEGGWLLGGPAHTMTIRRPTGELHWRRGATPQVDDRLDAVRSGDDAVRSGDEGVQLSFVGSLDGAP